MLHVECFQLHQLASVGQVRSYSVCMHLRHFTLPNCLSKLKCVFLLMCRYAVHLYSGGDVCEVTEKPRHVQVRLKYDTSPLYVSPQIYTFTTSIDFKQQFFPKP